MSNNTQQAGIKDEVDQRVADYERKEGFKSTLLEEEALRRGYEVRRLTFDTMIIKLDDKDVLFKDMNGPSSSAAMQEVCDNKYIARLLVRETGVNVPKSSYLRVNQPDDFIRFAEEAEYPVVIKPNNLARGQGVFVNIDSNEKMVKRLKELAELVSNPHEKVLIEKQYMGDDFRFFVVDGEVVSVTKRARASVTGDGSHSVRALIDLKNDRRKQNRNLKECLIPTDPKACNRLNREGKSLDFIPDDGEVVVLRDESNISHGGDSIDFTDVVHPAYREIAIKAVRAIPGLHYAGVDIIANDITQGPDSDNYVVTEVEFSPGPISMYPWKGEPRDMAGPVLDFYEQYVSAGKI
ncbi:MAG: hypothetical protein JJU16_09100 [Alkalibacterium sp.]|nr:hypothetical protein [Alkalibacterium sp.]